MDSRLFHFIKKEFIQLMRDPRMLYVAIFAPVVQLLLLGYVASTDIRHIPTAVFDQDKSAQSRTYVESFKNSGYFDLDYYVASDKQVAELLDSGRAKAALHIPPDFGRGIVRGEPVAVQAILDGQNSSSAAIISGYLNQINFENVSQILSNRLSWLGLSQARLDRLELQTRVWYNPEMKSVNFMVPAVFALILTIISMLLTAFSIVKEKESGTMEQLVVTPLKPYELILGKLLPFSIVAFLDITLVFLVATLWFRVPMHGSAPLLFALGAIFLTAGLGLGVFISTISRNQRQAMMSALFVVIPSMILSGFIFPIANMPGIIQAATYLIPVTYFLAIVRGIFLKGIGLKYLWPQVWPMALIGVILLAVSILRFRKRIE
jgi:ABC-2 type transport system permease protein